jgi:beta-lactamase regulating signal transducer with metallopeptidase domain
MIGFQTSLDGTFCLRLVLTFGHFLWQGTLVFLLAMLANWLLRRAAAQTRYQLLVASLLFMAICPVATFLWLNGAPARLVYASETTPESSAPGQAPARLPVEAAMRDHAPCIPPAAPEPVASARLRLDWRAYAAYGVAVYLVGALTMLCRLLLAIYGGQRLRNRSQPVQDGPVLSIFAHQAQALGLRFSPAIACCLDVAVPTVVGVLRPMVLLPLSFASELTPEQIELLLAHELAHIRRYDHLFNLLQRLIEAALFFHPAVWLISRRIRIEREYCCDDLVVAAGGRRSAYAESLVRIAELGCQARGFRSIAAAAALGAGGRRSDLRDRILRLVGGSNHERVRLIRAWPLVGTILLAALASCLSTTNHDARAIIGASSTQPAEGAVDTVDDAVSRRRIAAAQPATGPILHAAATRAEAGQQRSNDDELVGRVLAQRQLITSGHVVYREQVLERNRETDKLLVKHVVKRESWLDGRKTRTDLWSNVDPQTLAETPDTRRTVFVERGDIRYGYLEDSARHKEVHIVDKEHEGSLYTLFQPENLADHGFNRAGETIRDRVLPSNALIQVTRAGVLQTRSDNDQDPNVRVIVTCDYTMQNRHSRIYADPSKDCAIVRYESTGADADGVPWKSEVDLTYVLVDDTWFPKIAIWKDWSADGSSWAVRREVRYETLSVTINNPIAPVLFTVSGLNLPPGTDVIDDIGNKNLGPAENIHEPLFSERDTPVAKMRGLPEAPKPKASATQTDAQPAASPAGREDTPSLHPVGKPTVRLVRIFPLKNIDLDATTHTIQRESKGVGSLLLRFAFVFRPTAGAKG